MSDNAWIIASLKDKFEKRRLITVNRMVYQIRRCVTLNRFKATNCRSVCKYLENKRVA